MDNGEMPPITIAEQGTPVLSPDLSLEANIALPSPPVPEPPSEPTPTAEPAAAEQKMPKNVEYLYQLQVADCAMDMIQTLAALPPNDLKRLDTGGHLANLSLLYPTYLDAVAKSEEGNTDYEPARGYLTAMMHLHLQQIDSTDVALQGNTELGNKYKALPIADTYCALKRQELHTVMSGVAEMDPKDMQEIDTNQMLSDLVIAHWCESVGGLTVDSSGNLKLPPQADHHLQTLMMEGTYKRGERELILKLAEKGVANRVLTEVLGMDITKIRSKDMGSLYATQTAMAIHPTDAEADERRTLAAALEGKLTGKFLSFDVKDTHQQRIAKLKEWGIGALVFLPMLSSLIPNEEEQQR